MNQTKNVRFCVGKDYSCNLKYDILAIINAAGKGCDTVISDTEITLNESNYDKERISRLQRDLDTYLLRRKAYDDPNIYIGEEYEKYIGYLCTQHGYYVDFNGVKKQKHDAGIDIIAKSATHTLLIQCKCWNSERRINENVIDQLVGSKRYYAKEKSIPEETLIAVLVTSTRASAEAQKHAELLGVIIREKVYLKKHPQIKGFLFYNGDNAKLEYRLPFDEGYYDDFPYTFFHTVQEAEEAGYKRVAFKAPPASTPMKATPSISKRTASPIRQASTQIAPETPAKQKATVPQQPSPHKQENIPKEEHSVLEILFYAANILTIVIAIIVEYNTSTMIKGRLLSAVICGFVFGSLGFMVFVFTVKWIIDSIKELIDYFK